MNTMTVADLIACLERMPQGAEVRIATQPHWPLAHNVAGVASGADIAAEVECEEHGRYNCDDCVDNVVWIAAGDHPDDPNAPAEAWGCY